MANTLRFKRGLASGIPTGVAGEPLFTTDTFDLYIGNGTTNTRFQKYIASGATTQILRGDGSLYTFPLAISSPSNGQVLKYNGTSWVNDSDAGITGSGAAGQVAYFTGATTQAGNNNLFWDNTNGRLGIGTTNPNFPLHVIGNVMVSKNSNYLFDQLDNLDNGAIVWRNADGTRTTTAQITSISDGSFARKAIGFFTKDVADWTTAATEKMRITALGNLHIGTFSSDSGQRLQVTGDARISTDLGIGMSPSAVSNNNSINIAGTNGTFYRAYTGATETFRIQTTSTTNIIQSFSGNLRFDAGAVSNAMTLFSTGNLVVASTGDSGEKLQVTGTAKITGASSFGSTMQIAGNGIKLNFFNSGYENWYLGTKVNTTQFVIGSGTNSEILTFVNSGAATFSSSVTAASFIPSGSSVPTNGMYLSATNTLGFATASTLNMTLDASGYLSVGGLRLKGTDTNNTIYAGSSNIAITAESGYNISIGRASNTTSSININTTTGNLIIGSTTDTTEKLQVNGTAKITGATTFGGTMTTSVTSGLISVFDSTNTNGGYIVLRKSNVDNLYIGNRAAVSGDGGTGYDFYSTSGLDLRFFAGATKALTLATTGAATFSSSVTAASGIITGNLTVDTNTLFVDATNNRVGIGNVAPNSKIDLTGSLGSFKVLDSGAEIHLTRDGNNDFLANGGTSAALSIGGNSSVRFLTGSTLTQRLIIDSTGAANFSSSIQAATAIAIGTTPDTNNPFKILKNLNTTVGIKFENTNTSSLAFSAVQLGTDITGGTAFTNLVYGSSGTLEAGVFKPNGTALINTGSGGLNFLAVSQPIRFFTSTGNGTLRASITNDGDFTQFNGTNPSASTTDAFRMYSADVVAGNAAAHFRTENGAVIKLYQETTSVGNSIFSAGGGNSVLDDSTFDGYTLRQIVKALRNQGILA